jgi:small GTP-binding protein
MELEKTIVRLNAETRSAVRGHAESLSVQEVAMVARTERSKTSALQRELLRRDETMVLEKTIVRLRNARMDEGGLRKKRQDFIACIPTLKSQPRYRKASIAVLGAAGVGKSTLINKLVGKHVTEVGTSVTTAEFKLVHNGLRTDYYDVPGADDRYSYYNVGTLQQAQPLHLIILLYTMRVTSVLNLEDLIQALGVPYILVRNKVDVDIESAANAMEAKENNVSLQDNMMEMTYKKEKEMVDKEGRGGPLIYVSSQTDDSGELKYPGLSDLRQQALKMKHPVELMYGTPVQTD